MQTYVMESCDPVDAHELWGLYKLYRMHMGKAEKKGNKASYILNQKKARAIAIELRRLGAMS